MVQGGGIIISEGRSYFTWLSPVRYLDATQLFGYMAKQSFDP